MLVILSGIYCGFVLVVHGVPPGMSRAFMCGQGGISGDLAEIFRGEGNIKMMTGWVG